MLLGIFLMVMTDHVSNSATNDNTVSFVGEGKVFSKPDIAAISFSILTEAKTSKAAQDDNSKKSDKVVAFLKGQGIEDKDVKTTGYNVYPQYSYPQTVSPVVKVYGDPESAFTNSSQPSQGQVQYIPSNPKITGYQVNQSFEVKIRDLNKVSAILDGLVTQGANQVNQLGFTVDDIEKVKDQARELAVKDAKGKADTLKKQIGIRLGKIVNYYEGGGSPMLYMMESKAMDGVGGRGGGLTGPEVPAGENEIVVTVTLTYQIK